MHFMCPPLYMVQSAGFVTVDKVVVSWGINITVCFIDSGYIGFFFIYRGFHNYLYLTSLEISEEFALLWNIAHSSAQLTPTSWLGRDLKDEELVPSVVFL